MKIVLSVGFLPKESFANNNIEILLAKELAKLGHVCYIIGLSYDDFGFDEIDTNVFLYKYNVVAKYLKNLEKYINNDNKSKSRNDSVKKFILNHPIQSLAIIICRKIYGKKIERILYKRKINKFIGENNIDTIIAFSYPFEMVESAVSNNLNIKKIYYQFDPHGMHETLPIKDKEKRIAEEIEIIKLTDKTITTKLLKKQYLNHKEYYPYKDKIISMDFPTLIKKEIDEEIPSAFEFDENYINLLFCGTLNDEFRNPTFLMDSLKNILIKNKNIRVYFLGNLNTKYFSIIDDSLVNQIFIHSTVENDVANKTMQKADILINIGNTITNMMPSKIFDYFSTGKPIINVEKIDDCPSSEYFQKYPLKITLNELNNIVSQSDLEKFILSAKNKILDFDEIENKYITATPKYVADKINEILKGK